MFPTTNDKGHLWLIAEIDDQCHTCKRCRDDLCPLFFFADQVGVKERRDVFKWDSCLQIQNCKLYELDENSEGVYISINK